jgi:hypothetical protein
VSLEPLAEGGVGEVDDPEQPAHETKHLHVEVGSLARPVGEDLVQVVSVARAHSGDALLIESFQ